MGYIKNDFLGAITERAKFAWTRRGGTSEYLIYYSPIVPSDCGNSSVWEIIFSNAHLLALVTSVIVLVQDFEADIHPFGGDFRRSAVREMVGDRAPSNPMR